MSKVIYLPFEELPQRYTKMWNESFIAQMQPEDIVVSAAANSSVISQGEFLDTYGTIIHKSKQMQEVAKLFQSSKVENGDVFFVPDIFYPGLAAIRYMAELSHIRVKIVAFNHAGRADENDFVQALAPWADTQERAWHEMCDAVLVGSYYHQKRVLKKFGGNVRVTGAVWSAVWMDDFCKGIDRTKKDYIIWPHRPSKEKNFDLFLQIARANPALSFVITSCGNNRLKDIILPPNVSYRHNLTKREYYQIFAQADGYLSTALQETFGYTLQEAIYFGCKVIVPDYACYREYAHGSSIVSFEDMQKEGLLTQMYQHQDLKQSAQHFDNAASIYEIVKNI